MKNLTRWIIAALLIGWFVGAASSLLFMHFSRPRGMHERRYGNARSHFIRTLKLSPEQQTKVDSILQTSRQQLDAVFSETEPRVETIRSGTTAQIRQVLTPEQQSRFDRITARREAERKERMAQKHRQGPPLF